MEPTTIAIRKLIEAVENGQIRIPAFQRDFVWDSDRVAQFIDSLYKQYPFGSLLFWRAREKLDHERRLGPYELPDLADDYPIDYVLDGQQRVTSIFASFQTEIPKPGEDEWTRIYFDYRAEPDAQDPLFFPLPSDEVDLERHFPIDVIFDSTAYRDACRFVPEDHLGVVDDFQAKIKETLIPLQILTTDDRAKVAIVFERINHQGVPLDTLQLLTAWTWSGDFDLQQRFDGLREALDEHGFAGVGEDTSLILRCCAAILTGRPKTDLLLELNGAEIRDDFDRVENGLEGAVDFLRKQVGVETLRNLPYPAMLIPLSVFFSVKGDQQLIVTDAQRERLLRWFWRSCFSERYSGQTNRVAESDTEQALRLRNGDADSLGDFTVNLDESFFHSEFRIGSARTATFVLLLAKAEPRTFISGSKLSLESVLQNYNRHEFHHIFPRAFLRDSGVDKARISALANMCFLSRGENNKISRKRPSEYVSLMPDAPSLDAILKAALCPKGPFLADDYDAFLEERSTLLLAAARDLIGADGDDEGA